LHFPELSNLVDDHEVYLRIVADIGEKTSLDKEKMSALLSDNKASRILQSSESSMGAELIDSDINAIRLISKKCLELYSTREKIEKYIDEIMSVVAPNVQALVGSTLGARLIAAVGSLKALASKPSSTIQILGAEKALFRSLKTKAKPPKHGFIFQHPQIRQAPWWQRGKISRALAGKLAIAARIDVYSGDYRGDKLKKEFDHRVKEIIKKYPKPRSKKRRG
jgi:nucleolar protein 56